MILVVGATGDLGGQIVRRLCEQGQPVRALLRPRTDDGELQRLGVDVVRGDLTDPASLPPACADVSTVVMTATAIGRRLAGEHVSIRDVDHLGGLALVAAAESTGIERFVFVSYPGVDAALGTSLEQAKLAVEQRLASTRIRRVVVRPDAFQEIHLGPVARFDIANGKVQIVGRGDSPRRWIKTGDVAALLAQLAVESDPPEVIEVGGPEAISKNQLVDVAERVTGRPMKRRHMPRPAARLAIRLTSRRNDAMASALGAGLLQDLVPASWDDSALHERGIRPTSASDFVQQQAEALARGDDGGQGT